MPSLFLLSKSILSLTRIGTDISNRTWDNLDLQMTEQIATIIMYTR